MNVVICVAQYKRPQQLFDFVASLDKSRYDDSSYPILAIANTDGSLTKPHPGQLFDETNTSIVRIPDKPRQYASVVYEKIQAVAPLCNDKTILWNADPDYAVNPWALNFARWIFEEHNQVDYLCLLKEPGSRTHNSLPRIELSKFRFVKTLSCMGGAMMVRWKTFFPQVDKFFKEYDVTGEDSGRAGGFDQAFWRFLTKEKRGDDKHVFMIDEPGSLVQHCNTISNYLASKGDGGVRSHMHGQQYDPRINPFEWREALLAQEAAR